jgi:hypothetical protein
MVNKTNNKISFPGRLTGADVFCVYVQHGRDEEAGLEERCYIPLQELPFSHLQQRLGDAEGATYDTRAGGNRHAASMDEQR